MASTNGHNTDSQVTFLEAIKQAMLEEMERDPAVVLIGEDVGAAGGVFKLTEGLYQRFGGDRVRDTPISEQAILGAAMGAAMTGLMPAIAAPTPRPMIAVSEIGVSRTRSGNCSWSPRVSPKTLASTAAPSKPAKACSPASAGNVSSIRPSAKAPSSAPPAA